jgi:hypothetical protein
MDILCILRVNWNKEIPIQMSSNETGRRPPVSGREETLAATSRPHPLPPHSLPPPGHAGGRSPASASVAAGLSFPPLGGDDAGCRRRAAARRRAPAAELRVLTDNVVGLEVLLLALGSTAAVVPRSGIPDRWVDSGVSCLGGRAPTPPRP